MNLIIILHPILRVKCLADEAFAMPGKRVAVAYTELLQLRLVAENNVDRGVLVYSLTANAVVIVLLVVRADRIL